ncbi:MAG: sigma-70 family RNA polymerase sigma factor [Acidobacteriia bacterium]|nr:sigma-70 family RNA polymerase sigma factor [Terriglobia bacterium]
MASSGVLSSFEFNAMYIQSLQQGDPSTMEHFVSHFSPILLKKLRRRLRSMDQARDLRQETFLRVLSILRSEKGVRQPERFEILVLAVCNNVLHESYRHQRRLVQMEPEFDLPTDAPSPNDRAIANEAGNYVRRLLPRLNPNARAILEAVFLEEQSRDEICLRFGISRDHLRLLIYRAKKMFSSCAQKEINGKPILQKRCARRSGRRIFKVTKTRVTKTQSVVPCSSGPCAVTDFLPPMHATNVSGEQCWA